MASTTAALLLGLGLLGSSCSTAAAATTSNLRAAPAPQLEAPDCKNKPLMYPSVCCYATAPAAFNVTFTTTVGGNSSFTIAIDRSASPYGADRFYNLAKCGYFSNGNGNEPAGFFRVVTGFVVQFGIAGAPSVSNVWENLIIPNDPVKMSNVRGTIAYAAVMDNNNQAVNRTTQVYINYADNSSLDGMGFTPFGTVIGDGMTTVVDKIYAGYAQDPDQDTIYSEGDAYLKKNYPKLDYITATVVEA